VSALLHVRNVGKRFGGFTALQEIELEVRQGERLGLIGPNGSGKSTLVNCICGTLRNEQGSVSFSVSLAENLRIPILFAVNARGERKLSGSAIEARCIELLGQVNLADKAHRLPRDLTQIEMRKLELARAMAAEPKLLIADESMAGLSHAEVDEIIALLIRLNGQGVTVIMIEHIMRAVMEFSQRLAVLVAGRKIADGDPKDVVRNDEVVRAYLGE
jgi:branched-chain amino acid transport system ATP-binding protein